MARLGLLGYAYGWILSVLEVPQPLKFRAYFYRSGDPDLCITKSKSAARMASVLLPPSKLQVISALLESQNISSLTKKIIESVRKIGLRLIYFGFWYLMVNTAKLD